MNIKEYFQKLNASNQEIFNKTISLESARIAQIHAFGCDLLEFSELVDDSEEKDLIQVVCSQMETSALEMSYGLYRQALGSLRRALEVGLAAIYFSLNKLEHREWLNNHGDINWRTLIDEENGVLSVRIARAYWPELSDEVKNLNGQAKTVYRSLSQFVHGNKESWNASGISIKFNTQLKDDYFLQFEKIAEILSFVFCLRFMPGLDSARSEDAACLAARLEHYGPIREKLGGPKDL